MYLFLSSIFGIISIFLYILCKDHYIWQTADPFEYERETIPSDRYYEEIYENHPNYKLYNVYIPLLHTSDESIIHGWLLIPNSHYKLHNKDDDKDNNHTKENVKKLSLVLLSHGLGAQKDMGLLTYAEAFADAGYASLIIDYRHFGGSYSATKSPLFIRNDINPWYHVEDIVSVLLAIHYEELYYNPDLHFNHRDDDSYPKHNEHVLDDLNIDKENIVLWGTSLAGGHVLKVAEEVYRRFPPEIQESFLTIKGIISQIPHLDGKAATKRALKTRGWLGSLRVAILAVTDMIVSHFLGFQPIYVKIVGDIGDTAYMMLNNEEKLQYYSKHPKKYLGNWKNLAPARTMMVMSMYNPINSIITIPNTVPILFIGATLDHLCPIEYIHKAISLIDTTKHNVQLLEVNSTHFNVYKHKNVIEKMISFLNEIHTTNN